MLQIILAVIGISIVSTMGFIMLEQLSLQNQMQVQRENIRRLDVAADGLVNALGRLPGVDTLVPPAPGVSGSVPWSVLPADVGAVNSTVNGVPFLYCPVATLGSEELAGLANRSVRSVQMPNSNYSTVESGRYVVSASLGLNAELRSKFNPVAFIVAPGARGETPPDCSGIKVVNNVAVVDGGLVRVVSMPGAGSVATGADAAAEFWVTPSGTGNGRRADDPTSINAALTHFTRYSPDTMTIHVDGTVYAADDVWGAFLNASRDSGSKLRIIGSGAGVVEASAGGSWDIPASTFLENVLVKGPQIVVGRGDSLFTIGNVGITPFGGPNISIDVLSGGRFVANGSAVQIANSGQHGIRSAGNVELRNSSLNSASGQLNNFIWMTSGGELDLVSSRIGSASDRPIHSGIYSSGMASITSGDGSSAYASTNNGWCWASSSDASELAFKWSDLGAGSYSGVRSEDNYPEPTYPGAEADPAALTAYRAQMDAYQADYNERHRARRVNASRVYCG
jgi:hypothetical protein